MGDVFFSSDTHYDHSNILEYSGRPYSSVEEMNEALVENWNAVVRKGDVVYHLGDFALGTVERATEFAGRLNGKSSHHGSWQLYGHSHNSLKDDPHSLQLDVGVDAWDYRPASFEEVRERMSKKTFEPADHHGARAGGKY